MNRNVLYLKRSESDCTEVIQDFSEQGYHILEYSVETDAQEIEQMLNKDFCYFTVSDVFEKEIYEVCLKTATKYVVCSAEIPEGVLNCYSVDRGDMVFNDKEIRIYHAINEIYHFNQGKEAGINGLKELKDYTDEKQILELTDQYFDRMESEKELYFLLKELLLEYMDDLLMAKDKNSWREITLWNKKYECRKLCNSFWQFYLLQKVSAIYAEEMIHYYESGEEPSVIQLGSFQEISQNYFQLLLLLRRLSYDIAPEENADIVEFLMKRKLSAIFVHHVIEHNQVEDKEKVYRRFEELLLRYE